ncbi:MAG: hypothetical protein ABIB46_02595 [bacterium]
MEKKWDSMIDINASGVVIFFGTMNAMPMMYAHELRKLGQDVIYFVDVFKKNALCRPENHFPNISYPYPDWVIEFILPTQFIVNAFPKLILLLMLQKANRKKKFDTIKAVFLGGSFISFVPFLKKETLKIFLSHGSDFDVWCNTQNISLLSWGMKQRSVFKFFPYIITRKIIKLIVSQNFKSAKNANILLYFPKGLNKVGDRLISEIEDSGVTYIPRYDASFEQLKHVNREFKLEGKKLVIFSGVRFLYKTFPEANEEYSKGNDKIIHGLAMYKKLNKNIEIHFVEKGEDVHYAKLLCDEIGLSDVVVWHKEMPFNELINLYELADICFDQVGKHWIGAGMYALYIGKPLIANARNLSFLGESPIMNAETPEEICNCMVALSDSLFRKTISVCSKKFAEEKLGPFAVLEKLVFNYEHLHFVSDDIKDE